MEFTEEADAKHLLLRPIIGMYLRKQQQAYIEDLRKGLEQLWNADI